MGELVWAADSDFAEAVVWDASDPAGLWWRDGSESGGQADRLSQSMTREPKGIAVIPFSFPRAATQSCEGEKMVSTEDHQ